MKWLSGTSNRGNCNEPSEAGVADAHTLMAQLGIKPSYLIDAAYVDLLAQRAAVA